MSRYCNTVEGLSSVVEMSRAGGETAFYTVLSVA